MTTYVQSENTETGLRIVVRNPDCFLSPFVYLFHPLVLVKYEQNGRVFCTDLLCGKYVHNAGYLLK